MGQIFGTKTGIVIGNNWNPSCDYGSQLEEELLKKAENIDAIIDDINKELQNIKNENKNSEVSDAIVELLNGILRKFENTRIQLRNASTSIQKYYD